MGRFRWVMLCACALAAVALPLRAGAFAAEKAGVVSNVKVISDKVEDVTTLADWKKSNIKEGMTDQEKCIAIWKTAVKYRHQTSPPNEHVCTAENVHDPMKTIHVYGYGMCCCASSNIEGLARYLGFEARGRIINSHSVPEIFYDGDWHLFDASLMNYFIKDDGKVASVDDIRKAVRGWFEANPDKAKEMRGNDSKLRAFAKNLGWKNGPALLAKSEFYDKDGINGAGWHGWPSNMQEYDWSDDKAAIFDYGPSMGYQVNIQLRQGERLTRNWFNKGLLVPGDANEAVLKSRSPLGLQEKLGDIAPGRIGNGTLEYNVPLADGAFKTGALLVDNVACKADDRNGPALHVADAAKPGVLIIRMPTSYVYLAGEAKLNAVVPEGGSVVVSFSDNNGLDWKQVAKIEKSGEQTLDLKPFCYLRYDYRLKLEMNGKGAGLESLRLSHDVQHSQAPLPALGEGENTITFTAGAQEGTITIEGNMDPGQAKGKQLTHMDYYPILDGLKESTLRTDTGAGSATYAIETPGEITRVRMNLHYRARDAKDGYEVQMSFDNGKTFKKVEDYAGPTKASSKYFTCSDVPAGTKKALVKLIARQRNTVCAFDMRIDADYKEPAGGFRPVKVTYVWEENGQEKRDVHIAKQASETYKIKCGTKPLMKSVIMELAD